MEGKDKAQSSSGDKNTKADSVSSQILEYYKNYSQNRELPKYFCSSESLKLDEWKRTPVEEEVDNKADAEVVQEPLCPVTCPISPTSSVASNRRLEWDNGADIGYGNAGKNLTLHKSLSLPVLNTIEREKLQKTLLRRSPEGNSREVVQTKHTKIVSASVQSSSTDDLQSDNKISSCSSTTTQSNVPLKNISGVSTLSLTDPKTISENDSSQTFGKKYGFPIAESTPLIFITNQSSSDPEVYLETPRLIPYDVKISKRRIFQSTNKDDGNFLSDNTKVDSKKLSLSDPVVVECASNPKMNKQRKHKFVQTSLPKIASVALQTNSSLMKTNRNLDSNSEDNPASIGNSVDLTSVSRCTSFEYLSGSDYNRIEEVPQPTQKECATSKNDSPLTSSSSKDSPLAELLTSNTGQELADLQNNLELLQKLLKSKKYNEVTKKYYLKKITHKMCSLSTSLNKASQTKSSTETSSTSESKEVDVEKLNKQPLNMQTFTNEISPESDRPTESSNDTNVNPTKLPRSRFLTLTKEEDGFQNRDSGGGGDTNEPPIQLSQSSFEHRRSTSSSNPSIKNWRESVTRSEKLREEVKDRNESNSNRQLISYSKKERENQLSWIKSEITHLSEIKRLLEKKEKRKRTHNIALEEVLQKPFIENINSPDKATSVYVLTTHRSNCSKYSCQDQVIPPGNVRRACLDDLSYVNISNETPGEIHSRVFATNDARVRRYTIEIPVKSSDSENGKTVSKTSKQSSSEENSGCKYCHKHICTSHSLPSSKCKRSSSPDSSKSKRELYHKNNRHDRNCTCSHCNSLRNRQAKIDQLSKQLVATDSYKGVPQISRSTSPHSKHSPETAKDKRQCNCCKCISKTNTINFGTFTKNHSERSRSKSPPSQVTHKSRSRSPSPSQNKRDKDQKRKSQLSRHLITSEHYFGDSKYSVNKTDESSQTLLNKPRLSVHLSTSHFGGGSTVRSTSPSKKIKGKALSQHLVMEEHFVGGARSRSPSPPKSSRHKPAKQLSSQLVSTDHYRPASPTRNVNRDSSKGTLKRSPTRKETTSRSCSPCFPSPCHSPPRKASPPPRKRTSRATSPRCPSPKKAAESRPPSPKPLRSCLSPRSQSPNRNSGGYSHPNPRKSKICCCKEGFHCCCNKKVQSNLVFTPCEIAERPLSPSESFALRPDPSHNCCNCESYTQTCHEPQLIVSTTSTSTSTSSGTEEFMCECCKRKCEIPFVKLTPCQKYRLCNTCYSQVSMCPSGEFLFLRSNHTCNCYNNNSEIKQQMRETIQELEDLDENYCQCNCSCPLKLKTVCSCCNCKIYDKYNVAKGGLAYLLTVESDEKLNMCRSQSSVQLLKEVKVKVPSRYPSKHFCMVDDCCEEAQCQHICRGKSPKKHSRHKAKYCRSATLQEYLCINKPSFITSAENRRKTLIDLAYLREQRCQKYKQLLALTKDANSQFCPQNRFYMYSSEEMKRITARNYKKLPEVQHRLVKNRENQIRKANLILADIFNKNLRKQTLRGHVDYSTHASIIKLV